MITPGERLFMRLSVGFVFSVVFAAGFAVGWGARGWQ